jgi:hypothetical protein
MKRDKRIDVLKPKPTKMRPSKPIPSNAPKHVMVDPVVVIDGFLGIYIIHLN